MVFVNIRDLEMQGCEFKICGHLGEYGVGRILVVDLSVTQTPKHFQLFQKFFRSHSITDYSLAN